MPALLLKPVSFDCNLRCKYCFYRSKATLFGEGRHLISPENLQKAIRSFMAIPQEEYVFCWQGGEPSLAGMDFYQMAFQMEQEYCPAGARIMNAFQTNGTLLTDGWAQLFQEWEVLVGISVDGPPELHDRQRLGTNGEGTYAAMRHGLEALQRHRVLVNSLTVINHVTAKHGLEIYRHLRDELGFDCMQFIEDTESTWAVNAEEWGEFLCCVFEEWYSRDAGKVSVRLFDSLLAQMHRQSPGCCSMERHCGGYMVLEYDGSVYPCDFYVTPEWRLGQLGRKSLGDCLISPQMKAFAKRKAGLLRLCKSCLYQRYCAGDCPRNRKEQRSVLCEGWKRFFAYALPKLKEIQ